LLTLQQIGNLSLLCVRPYDKIRER
jgi:hypothetical protein